MNIGEIRQKIRRRIENAIIKCVPLEKSAFVSSLIEECCEFPEGDKGDAARVLAFRAAWDLMSAEIRAVKAMPDPDPRQTEMPFGDAYRRLQAAYSVERDGKHFMLEIRALSDDEIDTLAADQFKQGDGHHEHAKELLRYKKERMAIHGGHAA